jgi:hypothetical protein
VRPEVDQLPSVANQVENLNELSGAPSWASSLFQKLVMLETKVNHAAFAGEW